MKQSIEETLKRSQEVSRKYEQFKKQHEQFQIDTKKTQEKLESTITLVGQTLIAVQSTKDKYEAVQKMWDDALDKLAEKVGQEIGVGSSDAVAEISTPQVASEQIAKAKRVFILTGAGISAGSGIRTFRGTGGYWTSQEEEEDPKSILTLHYFQNNPDKCWKWLVDFYHLKIKAKPNAAHYSLNRLIDYLLTAGKDVTLLTQNIDNLHHEAREECLLNKQLERMSLDAKAKKFPEAGKLTYFEIHGNITKLRCQKCSLEKKTLVYEPTNFGKCTLPYQPPKCPTCSQALRPHIMFFDESYCEALHHYESAMNELTQSDLLIVVGTMLQTGMANGIVSKMVGTGKDIIEININQEILRGNTKCLLGKAEEILPQVVQYYEKAVGRWLPAPAANKNNSVLKGNMCKPTPPVGRPADKNKKK